MATRLFRRLSPAGLVLLALVVLETQSPAGAQPYGSSMMRFRYFGGSKPAAFHRSAIAGPASAAMKARAAAGSVLLAGMAAA